MYNSSKLNIEEINLKKDIRLKIITKSKLIKMDEKVSVSVIIPAWNEEDIIKKTADCYRNLDLEGLQSEIILISGGNDNTFQICNDFKFENFDNKYVLKQEEKDFKSGALIKGMKKSKGDILIIIDADVFVPKDLIKKIIERIKYFDVLCCDFKPILKPGFWFDYYSYFKANWARDPNNLNSLIGGATISLKREVIKEINPETFFSNKTTAGVDYYMGLVLKKFNKNVGLVNTTKVLVPRPNNIRSFIKDQKRWLNTFYSLYRDNKLFIFENFFFNIISCFFPILLFLFEIKKLLNISKRTHINIKRVLTMFSIDYLINLLSIKFIMNALTDNIRFIGHFKGEDRLIFD